MKFLYLFSTCLMALSSPILCAQSVDGSYESELQLERHNEISTKHCRHRVFGSATFRVLDPVNWYQVVAPNFPDSVRLTENRNQGFKEGEIHLRPYGLTIHQEGSYSVSFTAILANPDAVNERIMTVFIALDGEFDPNKAIANIAVLPPSGIGSASTTSILKNVKKGTKISLAMTSG